MMTMSSTWSVPVHSVSSFNMNNTNQTSNSSTDILMDKDNKKVNECWKKMIFPTEDCPNNKNQNQDYDVYVYYLPGTLPPNAVVGFIDMDAFEVQIYLKNVMGVVKGRELYLSTPCLLADPSTDRIIAVNFLAKAKGISREDRIGSAKQKCPEIFIIRKGVRFCKPENWNLRHSSWAVLDTILKYRKEKKHNYVVEYASNDEYFFDLTSDVDHLLSLPIDKFMEEFNQEEMIIGTKTFMEHSNGTLEASEIMELFHKLQRQCQGEDADEDSKTKLRLIVGCGIVEKIRNYIFDQTNFECSGAVSINKLLAKLACPIHKPGAVTILEPQGMLRVAKNISVEKLPSLGGDTGVRLREIINQGKPLSIYDLATLPLGRMIGLEEFSFGKMIAFRKLAHGISSDDAVVEKLMKVTATVGRANLKGLRFHHSQRICDVLFNLVGELMERLEEEKVRNRRIPESVLVTIHYIIFLPRKEEDNKERRPQMSQSFGYLFNDEIVSFTAKSTAHDLLNKIITDFVKFVKDQEGAEGIITKVNFSVKTFHRLE